MPALMLHAGRHRLFIYLFIHLFIRHMAAQHIYLKLYRYTKIKKES